jgi:hypothetical protein
MPKAGANDAVATAVAKDVTYRLPSGRPGQGFSMSDADGEGTTAQPNRYWSDVGFAWLELALYTGVILALRFVVLPHFIWFQRFDSSHNFWAELTPVWVVCIVFQLFFRRKARLADLAAYRHDLRQRRVRRISLTSRSTVMLTSLGLVVTGSLIQAPDSAVCLMIGVPMLLLFAVEELNIILRPGDSVFTDRHDELLAFFRARTLQVGYSIAILSLLTLYLVSLFASRYVGVLLPIVLTISLLAPSFLYRRLDRRAEADE